MNKAIKGFAVSSLAFSLIACGGGGGGASTSSNDLVGSSTFENSVSNDVSLDAQSPDSNNTLCGQSDFDQEILQAINAIRAVARTCGSEHFEASAPVAWSCELEDAALDHSQDMASNNFFSHTGSDGLRVNNRVDDTGYDWSSVGENIAAGYPGVDLVMDAWLASPSHCSTLMGDHYDEVGVGVEITEDADYDVYWTLVMANPA